uniref:Uncharacterized protein n=1 Tax=Aureoumbra lagunensis TaxID=44058 RepID=A0A7S3NGJ8_9STRA
MYESPRRTPSKARRASIESAVKRSARKELLEACQEFEINATTKDSTARLRQKVKKELLVPIESNEEDVPIEENINLSKAENLPNAEWKPSFFLSVGVFIVLVFGILMAPKKGQVHVKIMSPALSDLLKQQDEDTRESIMAFVRGWESPRRRHAVSLLLVGDNAQILAEDIARTANAQALILNQDTDGTKASDALFRRAAAHKSYALVVTNVQTTDISFAEHLIDPYLNTKIETNPPLDHSAFIFTFAPSPSLDCTSDRPSTARQALHKALSSLPTAFINRIQHASLLC